MAPFFIRIVHTHHPFQRQSIPPSIFKKILKIWADLKFNPHHWFWRSVNLFDIWCKVCVFIEKVDLRFLENVQFFKMLIILFRKSDRISIEFTFLLFFKQWRLGICPLSSASEWYPLTRDYISKSSHDFSKVVFKLYEFPCRCMMYLDVADWTDVSFEHTLRPAIITGGKHVPTTQAI